MQLAELLAMTAVGTFRPDAQFREFWQEDPAMQAHPEEGVKEEPPCMSEEVIDLTSSDSASSSDEGSSSSSGSDDDAAPAPVAKARRFAEANAPRADDLGRAPQEQVTPSCEGPKRTRAPPTRPAVWAADVEAFCHCKGG